MSRISESDRVKADQKQAKRADDAYKEWEDEYSCTMLEEYRLGKQWQGDSKDWSNRKYCINLFYPSINISKASTLLQIPKYKITPDPNRSSGDPLSDVEARAKLQEDTLNTFVRSKALGFKQETGLAYLDAQSRFGVIQVGYTADYIDNPNAGKPVLSDETDENGAPLPMRDGNGDTIPDANFKLKSEGLFLKWIPACDFRTSEYSKNRLSSNDWVGYSEWHYPEDLRNNPRYKNTKDIKPTGRAKYAKSTKDDDDHKPGMVKVHFKWDLRAKERRIWVQGAEKYLLVEKFSYLPLAVLKFDEILGQFYPLPVTFNWVHPQNQLNDGREMRRVHRRRAVRRYLRKMGAFTPEEWAKLCEGEDMESAEVSGDPATACAPMQDAPLDPAIFRDMADHLEDFTRESGISGESQQVAQSETATQANLIALMGQTRETEKRAIVGDFLGEVGRLMLLTLRENMALPFWIARAVDPTSPFAAQEAQEVALLWKQIVAEQLGDIDTDIAVDLASMSPVQQAQERTDWITFLGLVTNPTLGVVLGASPSLLRKTASMFNINSERDIVEVSKALQAAAMMAAQAAAAKAGVPIPGAPAPGPTPTNSAIQGQIAQQLPTETVQ